MPNEIRRPLRTWLRLVAFSTLVVFSMPPIAEAEQPAVPETSSQPGWAEATSFSVTDQPSITPEDAEQPEPDLLDLPLEALAEVRVAVPGPPPATLTELEPAVALPAGHVVPPLSRITPAAVTRIDYETIWNSGARRLDELLDIYVPNVEFVHQVATGPKMGIRGIISDRDDKFLLKVNGRIMNNRSNAGAFHERDMPLLGDLHHIDFLRGPGGATDGPGAIVGVVNMQTHTGLTFQGLDATVRQGFIEDFTATELRYGSKIDDDSGIFLYYGMADYAGADQSDSPLVYGRDFIARDGIPVFAGEPAAIPLPGDHQSFRSLAKHKFHAQLTHDNLDVWFRYTRGGRKINPDRRFVDGTAGPGTSFADLVTPETGYQQFTTAGTYAWELTDQLNLELFASYDIFDYERFTATGGALTNHEEELYTRALARWTPNDRHAAALGVAWSHEWFGLPATTFRDLPTRVEGLPAELTFPWNTDTFSLMGEYQWQINDRWTAFAGLRADDHTYSDWLPSPRAALVWAPNDVDTWKGIWTFANRRATDGDLRRQFLETGTFSENEENESAEIRYERRPCEHWLYASSFFYQYYTAISFNPTVGTQTVLGNFQMGGVELEASYRNEGTHFAFSHAYTQLIDGDLFDPDVIQGITAEPYGFGNDLASWSPNLTKIYVARDLDPCWSCSSSLRAYWGFPGEEDLTQFNNSLPEPSGFLGLSDPGYKKAFRGSYFLDFGLERKICRDRGVLRLDLYNVLGWIDKDLNKRNVLRRAYYRSEAPAIGLSAQLSF